ncbi:MAG TPA: 4-(cytidine 5'-diphospho)-2-C-methyl-D-erythritol kinase [Burkholderiaceae bacterium]
MNSLHNCLAPAKLNLFLHVTGRRPDGYHLLQTVFQLLDVGDTLHFDARADNKLHRTTDIPGVPEQNDLIIRAASLLQTAARQRFPQRQFGADIAVQKRLPMGGGLGGGSSDAATTLMALNRLWQTGFTKQELMALGLQLGADVPFFIFGMNAFAEGVGEELQTVDTPDTWYVIIEPGVSVPTAAIFSATDLTRDSKPVIISDFSRATVGFGKNDLQAVASKLFPPIGEAVEWLAQFGVARMTGSGACVFCDVGMESKADEILGQLPQRWTGWKAKSLIRHPLAEA